MGCKKQNCKKGVVFGIYFVGCSVASKKSIKVVIWAICECKNVLRQMPKSFREARVYGEVQAFKRQTLVPSFLDIFVL